MGITKQILGINLISLPTVLSFLGSPESPPSHQVGSLLENSPSRACPGWARESRPPPHVNPGPLKRAVHPPSSRALGFSGRELASDPGSNVDSQAECCQETWGPLSPSVSFSPSGFRYSPHSGLGWASVLYSGHSKRGSRSRGLTCRGGPQPPCTGWQGKWVGSPPAPRRFNGD